MYRPHHIGTDGIGGCSPCNTEICNLYLSVCGNHNILRLNIPVYYTMAVCCLQSHGYLNSNTGSFLYGKLAFLGNILFQSDSLDQFHDNIIYPIIFPNIKYIYNVRMCKPCCCLSFTSELFNKGCIFTEFRFQDLHSHIAVQLMILCLIDIRHSAGTDFSYYLIAFCYNHTCL